MAALIQVLYLPTTYQLAASADSTFPGSLIIERVLLVATHIFLFAAAFALIVAGLGEWMGLGSLAYYLMSGAGIGFLGFVAQYSSEVAQQPTIFNNLAVSAYLTSGFFAGLVYWLVAGRFARNARSDDVLGGDPTIGVPPPKSWKTRPKIVVEENPGRQKASGQRPSDQKQSDTDAKANKKPSLSDVLRDNAEASMEIKPAAAKPDAKPVAAAPSVPGGPASSANTASSPSTSVPSTKPAAPPATAPATVSDAQKKT
jgi:hypothetical protein